MLTSLTSDTKLVHCVCRDTFTSSGNNYTQWDARGVNLLKSAHWQQGAREREASWYFCSVTAWNERFATYNTHALLEKKKGKMYNLPTTNAALYSPRGFWAKATLMRTRPTYVPAPHDDKAGNLNNNLSLHTHTKNDTTRLPWHSQVCQ